MAHHSSLLVGFRRCWKHGLLIGCLLGCAALPAAAQLGIGTTAPDAKAALEIVSSDKGLLIPRMTAAQRGAIGTPPVGLLVYQTDGLQPGFWFYEATGGWTFLNPTGAADNLGNHLASQNLDLGTNQLVGNGGSAGLTIANGGQVGIGNTAFWYPLVVQADASSRVLGFNDNTGTDKYSFTFNAGGLNLNESLVGPRLFIQDGTGSIGIGTTAPRATLDVGGGAFIDGQAIVYGRVGIGTSTPGHPLVVQASGSGHNLLGFNDGSGTDQYNFSLFGGGLNLSQSNVAGGRLFVQDGTGNVGIGTITPGQKLEVAGTARMVGLQVTGGAAAGRVLTSDAGGNASWTAPSLSISGQSLSIGGGNTITLPTGADNLGNHSATQNVALNSTYDLRLRSAGDVTHGLGWYGTGKLWNGLNLDGPALYGFSAGVLGTNQNGTYNTALYWNSTGNVGIGNTSPAQKLDVVGTTRTTGLQVTGGAAAGRVLTSDAGGNAAWTAPSLSISGASLTIDGGNTITLPAGADNLGNHSATQNVALNSAYDLRLRSAGDAAHGLGWYGAGKAWNGLALDGPVLYGYSAGALGTNTGGSLTTALYWNNGGNVGIGTTSPSQKLEVIGSTNVTGNSYVGGNVGIRTTTPGHPLVVQAPPSGIQLLGFNNDQGVDKYNFSLFGGGLMLSESFVGGRLFIQDGSGNVGLGTTSPSQKLDVAGTTRTTALQVTGGAAAGRVLTSDAGGNAAWTAPSLSVSGSNLTIGGGNTVAIPSSADNLGNHTATQNLNLGTSQLVGNGGTSGVAISSAGNVGVGTTSPGQKLDVVGNANVTGNSYVSGNVGIGTTSPAASLDVRSPMSGSQILDQQQLSSAGSAGNVENWQSFTAGQTGYLTQLDLNISSPTGANGAPGTLSIYAGEGTGGALLSTQAITYTTGSSFKTYRLSSPPAVVAGQQYTYRFQTPTSSVAFVSLNSSNVYSGGRSNYSTSIDFLFKTYVTAAAGSPVPVLMALTTGNVGIGTASPATALDVRTTDASAAVTVGMTDGSAGALYLGNASHGVKRNYNGVGNDVGLYTTSGNMYLSATGSSTTTQFSLTNSGDVGIGTSSPSQKLEVVGGAAISGNVGVGTTSPGQMLDVVGNANVTGNSYVGGQVGIGTTSPVAALDVRSLITGSQSLDQQQLVSTSSGGGLDNWQSFTAGQTGYLTQLDLSIDSPTGANGAPGTLSIYAGEGTGGALLSTQAITYTTGSSFKTYRLISPPTVVAGQQYTYRFQTPTSSVGFVDLSNTNVYSGGRARQSATNDLLFKTYVTPASGSPAPVLAALYTGKVGIGTDTPAQTLDVVGTTRTTDLQVTGGAPATGKVLTSDASGNAAWTAPSLSISGQNLTIGGGNTVAIPNNADNLGNHTATQNLNLGTSSLVGNGGTTGVAISNAGALTVASLAGSGTRMVTTSNTGLLATAALPTDAQQLTKSGNTISLTNGGSVTDADNQSLSISGSTISLTNGGSVVVPSSADNLGNHTATQNLNLATSLLVGNGGSSGLGITSGGNVGIGLTASAHKLAVAGSGTGAQPLLLLRNSSGGVGNGVALDLQTYDPGANASAARIQVLDDGVFSASIGFLTKQPGVIGNALAERMVITSSGTVGIGTTPAAGLHVDVAEVGGSVGGAVGVVLSGGTSGNPNIELRGASKSPYIDFSETSSVDYTTRLISAGGVLAVNRLVGTGVLLNVVGGLQCIGAVNTSDQRLKQNVRPLTGALASVLALRGVRYQWNALGVQRGGDAGAEQVGVLAQEVEKVYPELVTTGADGYKAVNYAQLTPVLIEAIKAQQALLDQQRAEIDALKAQNATQTQRAGQAEAALSSFESRLRALEAAGQQARK